MKIELKEPFLKDFKSGYVNINKEPRRVLLLVRKDNTKTSMSYARYLMCCNLNRFLNKEEHVDHIDGDKLNDVIDNLQILTLKENNIKRNLQLNIKKADDIILICPICKINFTRESHRVLHKLNKNKKICCSRKCGGIYSHVTKKENLNKLINS